MTSQIMLEQAQVEYRILRHLRAAVQLSLDWDVNEVGIERKLSALTFVTDCFARHLQRMMSIEEEDGYMAVVVLESPETQRRIDLLREQHAQLREALALLTQKLHLLATEDSLSLEAVCIELRGFLERLDQHAAAERALLQKVFNCDIGGGD